MSILYHTIAWLFVCNIVIGKPQDNLQCKDENNVPVDWYVLYKLPKTRTSSNPLIREGLAYLYITNATIKTGWGLSTRPIGSNNSIPGLTLAPLYNQKRENETMWTLYNDSPPDAPTVFKYGHTKGVVMVNSGQGFWLIHSVPNYPPVPNGGELTRHSKNGNTSIEGRYSYPESGTIFGQSFLCVSLGGDQFDTVGEQLMYNEISVYAKNIPELLDKRYPMLRNATNQKRIKSPPYNHKAAIRSLGSVYFTSFAKGSKWQKDLYADFVAPQLQTNLYVQSWLNGRGKLPSTCSRIKIYNVRSLKFDSANVDFSSSRDHSKWAITVTNKTNTHWVCIGDINRADTQYYRGGGALCFKQAQLWKDYRNAVNDVEPCPRT
ncbi:PREDICTED: plancitoxin-1 [Dufourea novaeangliae]|uniref:Plancitoxin-1 n=1 Tax=Dufourea novaeangliae TaxID=178035 RepID=A0A154PPA5_DUFNO|nr:PREDICTED: plancitoxin-1 [Dufourea novaeangliae]KZC13284.1 Plancitoxin-1 [Dufourea novaeangliae]